MIKRFDRKAAAVFCVFMLLISLLAACAKNEPTAEEDRLLKNGYYEVYNEDDDLQFYCQVKDSKMILVQPDGLTKIEFRLLYDAGDDSYVIKKDGEAESFTVSESKNRLRIRTADNEKLFLKKVGKSDFPDVALATEVDGWGSQTAEPMRELRFLTGGESGTYYAFGTVIAQHATNNIGTKVTALVGAGSQSNIRRLADKEAELAFCQCDVLAYAYTGTALFEKEGKLKGYSVVGALYREYVQLVAVNPEIRSVYDLRGKRVAVGAPNSGTYYNAQDVLSAYDMTFSDIQPYYQSFGDSANDLMNGRIDAAFIVAGAPTTAVVDLLTVNKNTHLVPFDSDHMNRLLKAHPYYSADVISGGTYSTITADVLSPAVAATLIVRNDVSEETVYKLTKDIFDNAPYLISSHFKYSEVSPEYGASVTAVPYHPGAKAFYREVGLIP